MAVFFGCFETIEDICDQFAIPLAELDGAEIIYAVHDAEIDGGSAFVLFERDGRLYEVNGSHCSCYGLEHQWEPEETSMEALRLRKWAVDGYLMEEAFDAYYAQKPS